MLSGVMNIEWLLKVLAIVGPVLLIWTLVSVLVAALWTLGVVRCRLLTREERRRSAATTAHGHLATGGSDIKTASGL